jgi:hypothetical protein
MVAVRRSIAVADILTTPKQDMYILLTSVHADVMLPADSTKL